MARTSATEPVARALDAVVREEQGKLESMQAQRDAADARATSLEQENARLRGLNDDALHRVSKCEHRMARVEAQLESACAAHTGLRNQLVSLTDERNSLRRELISSIVRSLVSSAVASAANEQRKPPVSLPAAEVVSDAYAAFSDTSTSLESKTSEDEPPSSLPATAKEPTTSTPHKATKHESHPHWSTREETQRAVTFEVPYEGAEAVGDAFAFDSPARIEQLEGPLEASEMKSYADEKDGKDDVSSPDVSDNQRMKDVPTAETTSGSNEHIGEDIGAKRSVLGKTEHELQEEAAEQGDQDDSINTNEHSMSRAENAENQQCVSAAHDASGASAHDSTGSIHDSSYRGAPDLPSVAAQPTSNPDFASPQAFSQTIDHETQTLKSIDSADDAVIEHVASSMANEAVCAAMDVKLIQVEEQVRELQSELSQMQNEKDGLERAWNEAEAEASINEVLTDVVHKTSARKYEREYTDMRNSVQIAEEKCERLQRDLQNFEKHEADLLVELYGERERRYRAESQLGEEKCAARNRQRQTQKQQSAGVSPPRTFGGLNTRSIQQSKSHQIPPTSRGLYSSPGPRLYSALGNVSPGSGLPAQNLEQQQLQSVASDP